MRNRPIDTKHSQHSNEFAAEFNELMGTAGHPIFENVLVIEGAANELNKFRDKARTPHSDLDFRVFVPLPKDAEATDHEPMRIANVSRHRCTTWVNQHWGAAGFATNVIVKEDKTRLKYTFDTGLPAPEPIVETASELFGELQFALSSLDRENRCAEAFLFHCGVLREHHFKRLLTADEFRIASQFRTQSAGLTWSI